MADQNFNIKVVTTADTSGLKQAAAGMQDIRQQAEAPIADKVSASFTRAFTAAGGFGYLVARVINGISEETNKVTSELDKQSEHVVALAQKWTEMAQAATSAEDIAKIAASGVKEIETLSKAIIKAANPDFSIGATVVDNLVKRFKNLGRETEDALGPNEELADALFKGLLLDQQAVIELNARAIELGRTFESSFEKRKAEELSVALSEVSVETAKAKREQDALTGAMLRTKAGIDRYNELAVTLANLTRQTDLLTQADAKRQRQNEEAAKAAAKRAAEENSFLKGAVETSSPQTKAVLMNEEAARKAREAGDQKSADMYQRSADQLKNSMTQAQRDEYEQLQAFNRKPVGRKAGVGESQDAVDDIELNKLNAGIVQHGGKPVTKDQAMRLKSDMLLQDIITELKRQTSIWGN